MSGTAYGTVILHMVPEAAAGDLLALVQNGDMIELDVAKRKLNLLVSSSEIKKKRSGRSPSHRSAGATGSSISTT